MPELVETAPAQPAATASDPSTVLANMSETERLDWRKNGVPLKSDVPAPAPAPSPDSDPDDATPPVAAGAQPESRGVSKRQQQINDYERRIAEQNERIARLEAQSKTPAAPAQRETKPQAPAPEKFPDYATYLETHPDASLETWMDDRDEWRETRKQETARKSQEQEKRIEREETRARTYADRIQTATKTDPDFVKTLSPAVLALKPFGALQPGERGGPLNAIAEVIMDSEIPHTLMRHFTDHPEDLDRIAALPDPPAILLAMGRLTATLDSPSAPTTPQPKTITSAPAPPTTLGSRAVDPADEVVGAVRRKDAGEYIRAMNARELAASKR